MDENVLAVAFASVIAIAFIASAFLFNASNFLQIDFLSLTSVDAIFMHLLNPNLILLALIFPLPFAIVSSLVHSKEKIFVYKTVALGAFPATIISLILFDAGFERLILALGVLIGFVTVVEISFIKKDELKHLPTFRTASQSSKTAFTLLAVTLFISSGLIALENNDENVEKFGNKVMDVAFNQEGSTDILAQTAADLLIQSQVRSISEIKNTTEYQRLREKQDPDVQSFVAKMNQFEKTVASSETRQKVIDEIKKNGSKMQQPITFEVIQKQSPILKTITEYYWAIAAFATASLFLFVANILLSNLAGVYASIARKIEESMQPPS